MKKYLLTAALFSAAFANAQKWEGLAQTPPMGWNSWNTFASNINEKLVREIADACFLNRKSIAQPVNFDWSAQVIQDDVAKRNLDTKTTTYKLRDLWTKKPVGDTKKAFNVSVPPQDVVLLRLSK